MVRVDTELLGLQIVTLNDASVVGEVDGLIIDDRAMKVAGFLVDLGLFEASVLPFDKASAVGADAIIVTSADTLAPITADADLDTLATKDITISDARVMTRSGKTVGSIGDFFVDTDSGDVVGMEFIADDQSVYPKDVAVLPSAAVLRLGRDIVVVSDDYLQKLQRDAGSLDRLTRDDPLPALPPETALQPAPEPESAPEPELAPQPESASQPEETPPEPGAAPEPEASAEADEPTAAEVDEPSPWTEPVPPVEIEPATPIEEEAAEPPTALAAADVLVAADASAESAPPGDLESQPRHFLVGKRVLRRIEGVDGEVIAEEGDTVTHEMIQRARSSDQLLILSLNVE